MSPFYQDFIATPRGRFRLVFSARGIYRICFPGIDLPGDYPRVTLFWPGLEEDFCRYFNGEEVTWDGYPLDREGYRPFTAALLAVVGRVPRGRVISYREAAERAGSPRAWRAAGQALMANRHPLVVPCHRVVASSGKLGGFSGPPGWKKMLLQLEKAPILEPAD